MSTIYFNSMDISKVPDLIFEINSSQYIKKTILNNLPEIALHINQCPKLLLKYFSIQLHCRFKIDRNQNYYALCKIVPGIILKSVLSKYLIDFLLCNYCWKIQTIQYSDPNVKNIYKVCTLCNQHSLIQKAATNKKFYSYLIKKLPISNILSVAATAIVPLFPKNTDNVPMFDPYFTDEASSSSSNSNDYKRAQNNAIDNYYTEYIKYWPLPYINNIDNKLSIEKISITIDLLKNITNNGRQSVVMLDDIKKAVNTNLHTENIVPSLLIVLLFDDIKSNLLKYHKIFQYFSNNNEIAQFYLLKEIEQLILKNPALLSEVTEILAYFYELNIIKEQTFYFWYNSPLKSVVHAKSEYFIEWIKCWIPSSV